jgi:hypothetical protein
MVPQGMSAHLREEEKARQSNFRLTQCIHDNHCMIYCTVINCMPLAKLILLSPSSRMQGLSVSMCKWLPFLYLYHCSRLLALVLRGNAPVHGANLGAAERASPPGAKRPFSFLFPLSSSSFLGNLCSHLALTLPRCYSIRHHVLTLRRTHCAPVPLLPP